MEYICPDYVYDNIRFTLGWTIDQSGMYYHSGDTFTFGVVGREPMINDRYRPTVSSFDKKTKNRPKSTCLSVSFVVGLHQTTTVPCLTTTACCGLCSIVSSGAAAAGRARRQRDIIQSCRHMITYTWYLVCLVRTRYTWYLVQNMDHHIIRMHANQTQSNGHQIQFVGWFLVEESTEKPTEKKWKKKCPVRFGSVRFVFFFFSLRFYTDRNRQTRNRPNHIISLL